MKYAKNEEPAIFLNRKHLKMVGSLLIHIAVILVVNAGREIMIKTDV